ncbi:MAG TPA: helix-turn-helix domain-containing protein [Mycobacteriales bacterium]|nr:helix-turn-helix domain-containing protein [Mycobacteriales bacterium]
MSEGSSTAGDGVNRRRYNAPLRAAKAAQTRRRIVAAAHDLFVSKGYLATTVDEIAAHAGVSRPTVFVAVGGKPELLKLARDYAIAGDDEPVPLPQRPMFQELWAEKDGARKIALYARNMRVVHGRVADIEHVLQASRQADHELEELGRIALEQRRYGCRLVARSLAEQVELRDGLQTGEVADVLYAVASPEVFRMLTGTCGWSPARYERWLAATLTRELLAD